MIRQATVEDLKLTSESLELITRRGYNRQKDLFTDLERIISSVDDDTSPWF